VCRYPYRAVHLTTDGTVGYLIEGCVALGKTGGEVARRGGVGAGDSGVERTIVEVVCVEVRDSGIDGYVC
jgi:hypothetical protein